jgi:DNA-binding beta-propeller fold protein YncE
MPPGASQPPAAGRLPIRYEPIRAHRWHGLPDRYEFAPNRRADYVDVFDLETRRLAKRVQVSAWPDVTATSADGRYLYVAGQALSVIDLESLEVVRTLAGGDILPHYAVNLFPDGQRLFLFTYAGTIVVLQSAADPQRLEVQRVIVVNQPAQPEAAVGGKGHFCADGRRYINANWHTNSVFCLDLAHDYAQTTLVAGGLDKPDDLVLTADERKGYTASHGAAPGARGDVHVFDPQSGEVLKAIQVGRKPAGLTMSPDSRIVYASNVPEGSISAIDTTTDRVLFSASAAECYRRAGIHSDHLDIEGLTVSADGRRLYAYAVDYGGLVIFDDLGGQNRPSLLLGQGWGE